MKYLGFGLVIAGAAGFVASLGLFGVMIFQELTLHQAHREPLPLGREVVTAPITVRTDGLCRVGVRARIEAEAERRRPSDFDVDDDDWVLVFDYPLTYEVTAAGGDRDGEVLAERETSLSGRNYSVTNSRDFVRSTGGWIHGTFNVGSFTPPTDSDEIRVRLRLDPDSGNETEIEQTELIVFDGVKPIGTRIAVGITGLVLGLLSVIGGALVLVFWWKPDDESPVDADGNEPTST